jgi:hypothetical protein
LLEPSICLIFQGSKRVILGENGHTYDESRFFVTSIDLPVIAQILDASASKPYVGMVLKLDRMEIARLVMESSLPPVRAGMAAGQAIEIGEVSKQLLAAISRIVDLLEEPEFIPLLSPLIQREILLRLLMTECGPKIRQIAVGGSPTHQISRVIGWIKNNLSEKAPGGRPRQPSGNERLDAASSFPRLDLTQPPAVPEALEVERGEVADA